jgi:pimeloyl-ACP methyl ester carboxylesterase
MAASRSPEDVISEVERRSRRFETPCGDGSIVWRVWGDGPPLLLAHGSHGSWMHWIRNIDALATARSVWALDLPGWGDSAPPPGEDHKAISDAVSNGLMQLLAGAAPLDMVGFSFGGVALAYLAGYYPNLVRRLILVDTGGLDTPMGDIKLQGTRGLDEAGRKAANRANLLALMLHCPESVDDLALHIQATGASKAKINPVPYVLPDMLLKALPQVTAQIDAIWGEHDQPHPNPAAQAQVLRTFQAEIEIKLVPDAGHWAMYENPEAFNTVLQCLLDSPPRKAS